MDKTDRTLLVLAQQDGRASYAQYGKHVGLSAAAVHDRFKKLIRSGALLHWSAVISPEKTDHSALAFIRVQVDLPANTRAFSTAVAAMPEVLECHQTSGEWTCLIKVRAPSDQTLDDFISDRLSTLPGITRLQTERVSSSPKESHVLHISDAI